jgi:hypothetical protein
MRSTDAVHGRIVQVEDPSWEPLAELAPDHLDDFMWMFEAELDSGLRLHAYKHWWTRRYLHLDCEGRAFAYCGDDRYREVDPCWLLRLVLRRGQFECHE